jgi:hypothetical protein
MKARELEDQEAWKRLLTPSERLASNPPLVHLGNGEIEQLPYETL